MLKTGNNGDDYDERGEDYCRDKQVFIFMMDDQINPRAVRLISITTAGLEILKVSNTFGWTSPRWPTIAPPLIMLPDRPVI